ncbi:MAG TPA: aminotransferase class III-fold pyridoxal phosphate-dependent enzyme, partial [Armatimonadota bacterium]|nr:aminotransferase class III-fold pyridoxal phosphate-dependent enzyme [Armatimonadota bacterium]
TPGVPEAFAALTITIPFNDLEALRAVLHARGGAVACLIGEPVPANMGVVPPDDGYWPAALAMLRASGALLIYDEVITGFRLGLAGAQGWLGVTPDLCTLGKIIGGGLPVGAFGGRADLMRLLAPAGPVYQAGTLSGNPLAVAAGQAALRALETTNPYPRINALARQLAEGMTRAAADAGVPVVVNIMGSMLTGFFTAGPVRDFADARRADTRRYAAFFRACLEGGVMLAPSQFEAMFVSAAHTEADVAQTLEVMRAAFRKVAA